MKRNFREQKYLKLEKCKLRFFRKRDKKELCLLANNQEIAKNLRDRFPSPYFEHNAKAFLDFVANNDDDLILAIEVDGKLAGTIGLNAQEDIYRYSAELGYWLGVDYWNQGIMSCAVKGLLKWVFSNTEINRIFCTVFEDNIASARVLEKCGFQKEGEFRQAAFKRNEFLNEHRYSRLKS